MLNLLVPVGLLILGLVLCLFGAWAYRIGIAMQSASGGTEMSGVTKRLRSLSDWLKIPLVTLPFAFVAFNALCHLENARHGEKVAQPVANEVFWLVGWLLLAAFAAFIATAVLFLNRGIA